MEAWLSGGQWGRVQLMAWHLAANALGPLPAAIGQVNEPHLDASTASGLALCCSVLTSIPHWGSMEYTALDYNIKPTLFSQIFSMYHIQITDVTGKISDQHHDLQQAVSISTHWDIQLWFQMGKFQTQVGESWVFTQKLPWNERLSVMLMESQHWIG